jgi:AraC family transcriptional regulator
MRGRWSPLVVAGDGMILGRALWLVEARMAETITLQSMAAEVGVSAEWLTRSFSTVFGVSFMRYVWRRRLSRAAERLAAGEGSVIAVALDAGYGSPEAFARAFRAVMGVTPRDVILRGSVTGLPLQPALETRMSESLNLKPEIFEMPERRIVGLMRRYTMDSRAAIPGQWVDYDAAGGDPAGAVPGGWYGVCANFAEDGSFDYLCGVALPKGAVPAGYGAIMLPAGRWARFATAAHIGRIGDVWSEIYRDWMGGDRLVPRDGPSTEFYPPEFDGATGMGGYEIWLPVV